MGCWSKWDNGGCGCGIVCNTLPCTLPSRNLNLAYSFFAGTLLSGTATLVFSVDGFGECSWDTGCVNVGGAVVKSIRMTITTTTGPIVTSFTLQRFSTLTCIGGLILTDNYKTNGTGTGGWSINSFNCSTPIITLVDTPPNHYDITW